MASDAIDARGAGGGPLRPCARFAVRRLVDAPIIHPSMPGLEGERGENINGPSLVRVPDWIDGALGRYYLYFAHHGGAYIRMAYADVLTGPWTVYEPGVLHMDRAPGRAHIASPDVHCDSERRQLRMYFHQPAPASLAHLNQVSFVAHSADGLHFNVEPSILGAFYFRVFQYGGWHYAFAKGISYRSSDGLSPFEKGPTHLPRCRHTALWQEGHVLHLIFSRSEDAPESLLYTWADLRADWREWTFAEPELLLAPQRDWEGAHLPVEPSRMGRAKGAVNQLRDPAIYIEGERLYLLYSVAGERGIAIAELERIP